MPPSFVILDRVVWGVSAILGKLEVDRAVAGDAARVPRRRPAGDAARRSRTGVGGRSHADRPSALTRAESARYCPTRSPPSSTPAVTYSPSVRGGNVADPYKPRAPFAPWDRRELPGAVRRRGVGTAGRQLQVGRDEAVRGARRLGRHRARARREDAPRHALLQARVARRAVAQAAARAARDEPRPAHPAGQRRDGSLRRGDDRARGARA